MTRFFIVLGLISGPIFAQQATSFRAGVARTDITPDVPIWLAGYANRTKAAESVLQHLFAKALAIEDGQGNRLVIVSTDLLGLPGSISDVVADRALKQYGLDRSSLLLNSSHTHSGPVLRPNQIMAYELGEKDSGRIRAYRERLQNKLVAVIGDALRRMGKANLVYGSGMAGFAVNRREVTPNGVVLGVNRNGPVDNSVPVIGVYSREGKLVAVLFGYACHNTTLMGDFYQIAGDYAGFAQADLEAAHPGAVAMFLQLCGGNVVPDPRGQLRYAVAHGKALAAVVEGILRAPVVPLDGGIRKAYTTIDLPFAPYSRDNFEAELSSPNRARRVRAADMLQRYKEDGPPQSIRFPIQGIRFGDQLTILALGGEDVVEYALRAKREFSGNLIVAGYSNDVMAYIPSERMLTEGGYEPVDSMAPYGHPGPFARGVEERIFTGLHDIARQVGVR